MAKKKTEAKRKTSGTAKRKGASVKKTPAKKAPSKSARKPGSSTRKTGVRKKAGTARKNLTAADKKKFRALLISLRDHIAGQIDFLASDNLSRSNSDAEVDFRSEEQGTDNFNRDLALSRVSVEQGTIFEIDEAMQRLKMGSFGLCESCDKPIEKGRLSILPHSRLCVSCQSEAEKGVRQSFIPGSPLFGGLDAAGNGSVDNEE